MKAGRIFLMPTLPDKQLQIVLAHAGLIHAVVEACGQRERHGDLEPMLATAANHGWVSLVAAIRRILQGERDTRLLSGLDEEDRIIIETILRGLQNPATLPDRGSKPDPSLAAPGLAGILHAAATGDAAALQMLGHMAEQMLHAGGDLARLSAILRRVVNGERDADALSRGMTPGGTQLVISILEELGKLQKH